MKVQTLVAKFILIAIFTSLSPIKAETNTRCGNNCILCMPDSTTSDFCLLCFNRQLILTTNIKTTAYCSTTNLPTTMNCKTYGYRFDGSLGCVEC